MHTFVLLLFVCRSFLLRADEHGHFSLLQHKAMVGETDEAAELLEATATQSDGGRALLNTRRNEDWWVSAIYMHEKNDDTAFQMWSRPTSGNNWYLACTTTSKSYNKYYHTHYISHGCSPALIQVDSADPEEASEEQEPEDESDKTPPKKDKSPPRQPDPTPPSADVAFIEISETAHNFWTRQISFNDNGIIWCKDGDWGSWKRMSSFESEIDNQHWNTWFYCWGGSKSALLQTPKEVHEIDAVRETDDGPPDSVVNLIESSQNSSSRTTYKPMPACHADWYKKKAWYTFNMLQTHQVGDEIQVWCGNGDNSRSWGYDAGSFWRAREIEVIHPDNAYYSSYYDQYLCLLKCE